MTKVYRHTGSTRYLRLAGRDYTEAEYTALDTGQQRIIDQSGEWEVVDTRDDLRKISLDDLKASALAAGVPGETLDGLRAKHDVIAAIDAVATSQEG